MLNTFDEVGFELSKLSSPAQSPRGMKILEEGREKMMMMNDDTLANLLFFLFERVVSGVRFWWILVVGYGIR